MATFKSAIRLDSVSDSKKDLVEEIAVPVPLDAVFSGRALKKAAELA